MLSSERKPAKPLTRREREIAALVAEGLTNREISRKLFISERTAEGHVEQIRNKLGFTSRSQVASWATQNLASSRAEPPAAASASIASIAPEPAPSMRPRPALLRWPFGRAGVAGVLVIVLAILGIGAFLLYKLSPTSAAPGIYTFAGTGVEGYLGDGGPPLSAELDRPTAIAINQATGDLYIVDGNRVRLISGGTIDTAVGSGKSGALPADGTASRSANLTLVIQFTPQIHGLAIDSKGDLYIADRDDHTVWKATKGPSGTISRFAGDGTEGSGGDSRPAASAELQRPVGLAFDSNDNLFIADPAAGNVREVSNGVITTLSIPGLVLSDPNGLAVDRGDNLWIADTSNHRVVRVTPQYQVSSFSLDQPIALAVDIHDNVYVADGNQIWRIDAAGGKALFAGEGKSQVRASLNQPLGVAVDAAGDVFIVDTGNNRVREIPNR